jgi:NAD(P)-dependent dehydrogenase (short-subunit alcohol dehydrogenase family)
MPDAGGAALQGKVALVTGGASGIGRAVALAFAGAGARIALFDVDTEGGRKATAAVRAVGVGAVHIAGNATVSQDCRQAVETTVVSLGGLDILVNSAGVIRRTTVIDTSEAEWDHTMAVNVKSVFLTAKYAIPVMHERGGGAIVNIASGWGLVGGRDAAAYCASKGAVVQLTKAMALDHGGQGVRVNCVCPGDTDTPLLRSEAAQLGVPIDVFLAEAADRPLRRLGRPEDVAQAALYLASDAASFVTGVVLVVDGGGIAG